MKITVVQIAKASDIDGNIDTEYLDSAGRVWYDTGRPVLDKDKTEYNDDGKAVKPIYKWVSDWRQVELPDVPTVDF